MSSSSSVVVGLSPPWYTLLSEVYYTFGVAGDVRVESLRDENDSTALKEIIIVTENRTRGEALSSLINPTFQFGNITVNVSVQNSQGQRYPAIVIDSRATLEGIFVSALGGNPLFVEAKSTLHSFHGDVLGVAFTKSVIQFYQDNLAELYSNYNGLAVDVFKKLLNPSILAFGTPIGPIVFGTSR